MPNYTGPNVGFAADGQWRVAAGSVSLADMSGGDAILSPPSNSIRVNGAGTLKVDYAAKTAAGTLITDTMTLAANTQVFVAVTKIYQTGTTATGITVFW